MKSTTVAVCLALTLLLAFADSVLAWGAAGHSIVAEIAERRLSPPVERRIHDILGDQASLASISNWADTYAAIKPSTRRWHFVNIPVGADSYVADRDCRPTEQGDCVVRAIERAQQTLADENAPREVRAEALKLLVHLVADAHQPLHCAERDNDAGGSLLTVDFFGQQMSLHQVWDIAVIEKSSYDWGGHVSIIVDWLSTQDTKLMSAGSPADWVWECHRAAVEVAYRLPQNLILGEDYQNSAISTVHAELGRAGVRLARLLCEALKAPSASLPAPGRAREPESSK